MKKQYSVIVGNVGTVLETTNRKEAVKTYGEYKRISIAGAGRAGGEDVTLFCNDELLYEHFGALHNDN
ncbi:MAG TPA: hypothetical protein PLW01_02515 [Agitococcus sp.]|nr:hypothetical protein [Agitococcus sp.]